MARPLVLFLSDYGLSDPFAGVCHAVMEAVTPGVRVIDLTHGVPRQDVTTGATLLADCLPHLPDGVVLAVVDPGVGTQRRAVAALAGGRWFVGPDNGLLAPAMGAAGDVTVAYALPVPEGAPPTFHGRDVFAPAAARLAAGADPGTLGSPLDPADLAGMVLPRADVAPGRIAATALVVDGFGNVALSAAGADLADAGFRPGDRAEVRCGTVTEPAVVGRVFADAGEGGTVVLADSSGRLAVAVNRGSAAARLGLAAGERVVLTHPATDRQ